MHELILCLVFLLSTMLFFLSVPFSYLRLQNWIQDCSYGPTGTTKCGETTASLSRCSVELKINQEGKSDSLQNVFELRHSKLKNTLYKPLKNCCGRNSYSRSLTQAGLSEKSAETCFIYPCSFLSLLFKHKFYILSLSGLGRYLKHILVSHIK